MCIAQRQNTVPLVRLEPRTPPSQVKNPTTEPLLYPLCIVTISILWIFLTVQWAGMQFDFGIWRSYSLTFSYFVQTTKKNKQMLYALSGVYFEPCCQLIFESIGKGHLNFHFTIV